MYDNGTTPCALCGAPLPSQLGKPGRNILDGSSRGFGRDMFRGSESTGMLLFGIRRSAAVNANCNPNDYAENQTSRVHDVVHSFPYRLAAGP